MNIKKILFSLAFIGVFGIYVIYERASATSGNSLIADTKQSVSSSAPASNSQPTSVPITKPIQKSGYTDGQFTGVSADAFYGLVQVEAVISGGKIIDIKFLNYPQDRQHSIQVSNYSLPQLRSEAIQAQSSNIDVISGATATSEAFIQSLSSALLKAS